MGKWSQLAQEQAEEKVRQRTKALKAAFPLGTWVEIDSPLFGRCTGKVAELEGGVFMVTEHSVLKERTTIPVEWVHKEGDGGCPSPSGFNHR